MHTLQNSFEWVSVEASLSNCVPNPLVVWSIIPSDTSLGTHAFGKLQVCVSERERNTRQGTGLVLICTVRRAAASQMTPFSYIVNYITNSVLFEKQTGRRPQAQGKVWMCSCHPGKATRCPDVVTPVISSMIFCCMTMPILKQVFNCISTPICPYSLYTPKNAGLKQPNLRKD